MPAAAESTPAPEPPAAAKPATEQVASTQAEFTGEAFTSDDSDAGDQGLTPFPTWQLDGMPASFTMMNHEINTALPLFTPEPPILHGQVPEPARGKELVMEVVINDHGTIVQVEVLQEVDYNVEYSIVQTLRRWVFVPAKVNGVAIASKRQLHFRLPG
jgi:hypothetical protein